MKNYEEVEKLSKKIISELKPFCKKIKIVGSIGRHEKEHVDIDIFLIENTTANTAIFGYKKRLQIKDDLFISKDKILPDISESESWSKKFEDILGNEF